VLLLNASGVLVLGDAPLNEACIEPGAAGAGAVDESGGEGDWDVPDWAAPKWLRLRPGASHVSVARGSHVTLVFFS